LFINGRGGWAGRKGADVVHKAKQLWPDMPLTVYSQRQCRWPPNTEVLPSVASNNQLYTVGDVLLAPHTADGVGLEPMEAMASGMPVITPDAAPWNENPALARVPVRTTRKRVRRMVDWQLCDAAGLVALCKQWLDKDIMAASQAARKWAESRDWSHCAQDFRGLLDG